MPSSPRRDEPGDLSILGDARLLWQHEGNSVHQLAPDIYIITYQGFGSLEAHRSVQRAIGEAPDFRARHATIVRIGQGSSGFDRRVADLEQTLVVPDVVAIVTQRPMIRAVVSTLKIAGKTRGWRKIDAFRELQPALEFVRAGLAEDLT